MVCFGEDCRLHVQDGMKRAQSLLSHLMLTEGYQQDPQFNSLHTKLCSLNGQSSDYCYHSRINPLTPNDHYSGSTAPLTSKRCILYIYSTNTCTEYFKHGIQSPFFFSSKCSLLHNSKSFGSCIIHILCTGCAKIKKNNSGAKRLMILHLQT